MRAAAVRCVIAATLLGVAGAACARNASNGYRIHQFASAIKGTERTCQSCRDADPKNSPNAMLANVNIGTACGQSRPQGTAHALKGLCNIGAGATQTDAETGLAVGLANPRMAQFAVLSAAERSGAAECLRAVHPNLPAPGARPQFSAPSSSAANGSLDFGPVNEGATATPMIHVVNVGDQAPQIASNAATPHVGELSIVSKGLVGPSATSGPHVVALEGVLGAAGGGLTSASINRTHVSFSATSVDQASVARTVVISTVRW